jgi:hypothetical protein
VGSKTRFAVAFLLIVCSLIYRDFVSFAETATPSAPVPTITDSQRAFFESKIRPVLASKCYSCHSAQAKEVEDNLLLDTRAGVLKGGVDGPVIVPRDPDKSLMIQALRYGNKDLQMPPPDSGGKLADNVIHDFETWIRMGAPDPRGGGPVSAAPAKPWDTNEAKKWWSFQPIRRSTPPQVSDATWVRGDIDRYVMAGLDSKNLKPVADADKQTVIRRVYFDLIGLPPTPEEVDAFLRDDSPNAFESVVDDLLSRPQFGEHWGRHWLDVARYAESTGKDFNVTFPNAWRYRDYVIASFNSDKPYNQFVTEQLAGDLMPSSDPKTRAEHLIATGFLAIGPKGLDEMVPRQFDLDLADEQVDATTQAFEGLTVSCARCHDHKFDPVLQTDYYAMAGIFLSTKTDYGTVSGPRNNQGSDLIELPKSADEPMVQKPLTPEEHEKLMQQLADATAEYQQLVADRQQQGKAGGRLRRLQAQDGNQQQNQQGQGQNQVLRAQQIRVALGKKAQLENEVNMYDPNGQPKAFCMGVHDRSPTIGYLGPMQPIKLGPRGLPVKDQPTGFETIADSPVFFRGEMSDPRGRVPRGVPVFLLSVDPARRAPASESGRKELADWIVSPRNPLTARVMANRIWYWLFDQGIVPSVDNFGTMGDTPSNQPLLDYLAMRLVDNKWSIKKTIREIVLSHAYQLSGAYDDSDYTTDPQNALVWRHSKRRLTAECLRDAMLASSGQLNLKPPLGSPIAYAGNASLGGGAAYAHMNEQTLTDATGNYRSVYLPVARDEIPDSLAVFDYPDSTVVHGARETTNVPSQGLYMLNSDFVRAQAHQVAMRILKTDGSRQDRVNLAFRLILDRPASESDQATASAFFAKLQSDTRVFAPGAWTDFCLALYNTAEFRYLN